MVKCELCGKETESISVESNGRVRCAIDCQKKDLVCTCDTCTNALNIETGEGKKLFSCILTEHNLNNEDMVVKCSQYRKDK